MHDLPPYVTERPTLREMHGLEVGDEMADGFGPTETVTDIDDEGVEFSDGSTASHNTVVINMKDMGLLDA